MKNLLFTLLLVIGGNPLIHAQSYPITTADGLQQLVVQPDLAQLKLLIFDDTYVYADRFLYFAVLQGLAKDGMPIAIAHHVATEAQGDNFVSKCKICDATRNAFTDYAKYGAGYDTHKNPYPDLASKKAAVRHEAIKKLMDKYTSAFSTLLELSTLEQERLQNALGTMRKQGMSGMNGSFGSKYCPSCDGATHTD